MAIFLVSTTVTAANMFGQVELNDWNGRFFDAVGRKDLSGFVHDLWTFVAIIAVLLALTVAQTFLQERLKFRLREWITRHLLVEWFKPLRVYQPSFAGQYGRNPDQRIQEDTRLLGDYRADLGCGIVYSLLQIVAFVGVLWALSAQVTFQVAGYDIAIPGYMVWCALAYASIGSGLTWLVGRPPEGHDTLSRRVHPPLPDPRPAVWLPPHPSLWPACQRHARRQHRPGPPPACRWHSPRLRITAAPRSPNPCPMPDQS